MSKVARMPKHFFRNSLIFEFFSTIVEYLDYQIPVTRLKRPKGDEFMQAAKRDCNAPPTRDLNIGDRVLIKNVIIPHKLTPTFDPTVYEVTSRDGDVVQVTGNGKSYTRNASHLKKVESSAAVQPEKGQSPKRTDESFPAKPIDAELTSQMPQGGLKLGRDVGTRVS